MKELSICLRGCEDKLREFCETLKALINNDNNELLFIDNSYLDTELVDLCFAKARAEKVLILDNDFQIDDSFLRDILENSYSSIPGNINYEIRRYISPDRPIYYNSVQTIIYDKHHQSMNTKSSLIINDFTPINPRYMDNYLNTLIKRKDYMELYLWYKYFISRSSNQLQDKFIVFLHNNNFSISDFYS